MKTVEFTQLADSLFTCYNCCKYVGLEYLIDVKTEEDIKHVKANLLDIDMSCCKHACRRRGRVCVGFEFNPYSINLENELEVYLQNIWDREMKEHLGF